MELAEPVDGLVRLTITRRAVASDHITKWSVYGSNDPEAVDDDWVKVASLESLFGNNTETINARPSFESKNYKYLRFYIDGTTTGRGYGHMSEFQLYQMSIPETSQYALIGEPAKNLDNVLFEQAEVDDATVTQETYDELKAAYDAFMALYVDPAELRDLIAKAEAITGGIVVGTNPGTWKSENVADDLKKASLLPIRYRRTSGTASASAPRRNSRSTAGMPRQVLPSSTTMVARPTRPSGASMS